MSVPELMPNLQLVPMEKVRFHEHPEHSRTLRLVERVKKEQRLRNPPIVADMGGGDFLLLDGANRVSAFRELGYSHIPVQVVDYGEERVQLKGWHHLLVNGRALKLRQQLEKLSDTTVKEVPHGRLTHLLELRMVYGVLVDEKADCWGLFPEKEGEEIYIRKRIEVMERVVASYEGKSKLERIKLADFSLLPEVMNSVEHQLCLFPVLTKNELLQMAREGVMIPTGLTRHLIPGRALGINIDLGFLSATQDAAAKIGHFNKYIDDLEVKGKIRFYEESVFVMNE